MRQVVVAVALVVAVAVVGSTRGQADSQPPAEGSASGTVEWTHWGGDERSSRYSPLDQVTAANFSQLEVAWRWKANNYGPEPDLIYRATPLYVNGKLYTVAGQRRTVVCIDPATGETLWMFREKDNPRWAASTRQNYGKGVAFARVDGRPVIYLLTPGFYLWALDADTGQPLPQFGMNGVIDLHLGLGAYSVDPDRGTLDWGDITSSSAPIVVNGVVVVGNSHDRGYYPENRENVPGIIRGYDAKTGRMLWRFDPVPKEGEPGNETWENESWRYTGNVSPWAPLSADSRLGLVYVPTDTPTNDYYGGSRHGMNLYGTSLLALDVQTGKLRWFYQFVHHDVWNHDIPDAPHLMDLTVNGRAVPAIVQATKQGWMFVFNRETGEPIWPIEERPVPASDVPHEKLWPTQPHVTWPPPFEQQGVTEDDLIDFTPALRAEAVKIARQFRMRAGMFNPPSLFNAPDGTRGAFMAPSSNGGANIPGGAAVDPETGYVYVASQHGYEVLALVPAQEKYPDGKPWPGWGSPDGKITSLYVSTSSPAPGPSGGAGNPPLPLMKPPYGRIVAYDMNTGDLKWNIPNGETPDRIRNHPALKGVEIGNTGQNSHANLLVTKSLLMYGEGRGGDRYLRALDKRTGQELAKIQLPAQTNTAPMTFMHAGQQYIVAAIASAQSHAELVALRLPSR
ncbi:MAG: PQQ-binding-like beta-propeller repeat protein [Vicinamibacterales bacterium]|nr:PQQ-binding-like beta-propeller repeat protein [Vicinamibacterales bacterium]